MKYSILIVLCCLCCSNNSLFAQNETSPEASFKQHQKEGFATNDSIFKRIAICRDRLSKKIDNETRTNLNKEYYSLFELIESNSNKELQMEFNFIRNNTSSSLCLDLLYYRTVNKQHVDMYDTFYHYFSMLSETLKNNFKGRMLTQEFVEWKNNLVGSYAQDFDAKDIEGKEVSLSSYKGKSYVILDFWGSRCGPCRHEMPFLKDLYSKYHEKGLEIIGISSDTDIDSWEHAVEQDGTRIWRQVSQKQNNAKLFREFYVQAMPVKVLVNKEGVIIGRWYSGAAKDDADLAKKLQEAFGM